MSKRPVPIFRFLSRFFLFQGVRPFQWSEVSKNLIAGFALAAMNIPQSLGYTKIAGTPVITGLYTLLLPLVALFRNAGIARAGSGVSASADARVRYRRAILEP